MANEEYYRYGNKQFLSVPIASATVVSKGDLLVLTAGLAVPMAAATENLTFLGVSEQASADGDTAPIRVSIPVPGVVYEYPLDAETSVAYGDKLAWSAVQKLTATATDAIAIAVETDTTATVIKLTFLASLLFRGDVA